MVRNARRYIRKMRGGAQSHLLEADDGRFYVVKFIDNPQHRRILVNELLGSAFLRYLQISTPETALINLSAEFLQENPDVSIQLGSRRKEVTPGWHFGSCFPGDPARLAVYDFLPDVLLGQVVNVSHFLGVLVVDKWMANANGRQSIYFRARVREWIPGAAGSSQTGFVASMIDQGFVFNGPYWEFPESPIQGLAPRTLVYQSVRTMDDFQPWLDQVVHFPEEVIDAAAKRVPPPWLNGDEDQFEALLERLLKRRKRVPDLVLDCRSARTNPFLNWRG
jgi:hypothetical protein